MAVKPMLAAKLKIDDLSELHGKYPLLATPKIDGVRVLIYRGKVYSRTGKLIPNDYVQQRFGHLQGVDGELVVGDPYGPDVFRRTVSGVMAQYGEPDVKLYAFDLHNRPDMTFEQRYTELMCSADADLIDVLLQLPARSEHDVTALEESFLRDGYEGIMLRTRQAAYKYGRSTLREAGLIKLKRFRTSEAIVIGVIQKMVNQNEAKPDELGFMKRSSHKSGLVPVSAVGALSVRDLTTGLEFEIGSGLNDSLRGLFWRQPPVGKIITYKYFPTKNMLPRFPVFINVRPEGV